MIPVWAHENPRYRAISMRQYRGFVCIRRFGPDFTKRRIFGIIRRLNWGCVMFNGFPEATEQFFLELKFHNDQTFVHANHDR